MLKKSILILISATLFFNTTYNIVYAQINNVIIFGDSLSDTGNFPESSNIWWRADKPKTILNAVPQFYVPFANPVVMRTKKFSVPIAQKTYPWPSFNKNYLATQALVMGFSTPRRYRSVSWPQFFLAMAKAEKLIAHDAIAPTYLLTSRHLSPTLSFNYAWGYAPSGKNCVNPYYETIASCDENSIHQARLNYINHPTQKNYLKIEVPGLIQQISLFQQDLQAHRIAVTKNTKYIFWIGGNDLIMVDKALRHFNVLPLFSFLLGSADRNVFASINKLITTLPKNSKPTRIYVFALFNPGFTPAFYKTPLAPVGNFLVRVFNIILRFDAFIFNFHSATKIMVVPSDHWFRQASQDNYFKINMGKTCQLDGGDYTHPAIIPKTNCAHFMFWNSVHVTTQMNALVAYRFYTMISKR